MIGGGNTAADAARTLLRMGATPQIAYRRRKIDMPAFAEEIDALEREGIPVHELVAPSAFHESGGKLDLRIMEIQEREDCPMRRVMLTDKSVTLKTGKVVTAIGAEPDPMFIPGIVAHAPGAFSNSFYKNDDFPVIYGGDLVNSTQSVADAVLSGKQAAVIFDVYFTEGPDHIKNQMEKCRVGDGDAVSFEIYLENKAGKAQYSISSLNDDSTANRKRSERGRHQVSFTEINTDYFPEIKRQPPDINKKNSGAEQGEAFGYTEETARKEALRCFNCGYCNDCNNCVVFCPDVSVKVLNGSREVLYDYCKGCGICVAECPRNVISLREE